VLDVLSSFFAPLYRWEFDTALNTNGAGIRKVDPVTVNGFLIESQPSAFPGTSIKFGTVVHMN
jgi:hypothetical protein